VSLGVVDEAIYTTWLPTNSGNIKSEFYGMRYNSVETHLSISIPSLALPVISRWNLRNKSTYQLADFKNEGD